MWTGVVGQVRRREDVQTKINLIFVNLFFYFIVFLVVAIKYAKLCYTSSRGIVSSYIATKNHVVSKIKNHSTSISNSRSSSRRSFAASIHLFTNAFGSNLSPVDEVNAPPWTTESMEDAPEFVLVCWFYHCRRGEGRQLVTLREAILRMRLGLKGYTSC